MFDTELLLMVSIFRKAAHRTGRADFPYPALRLASAYPLNRQPTAAMFLHHFRFEIDRTCRVLKLLGAAAVVEPRVRGWRGVRRAKLAKAAAR
jgi:hypothetical protein